MSAVRFPRVCLLWIAFVLALGGGAGAAEAQVFKPRSKTAKGPKNKVTSPAMSGKRTGSSAVAAAPPAAAPPAAPKKAPAAAAKPAAPAKKAGPAKKKKATDDDDVVIADDDDDDVSISDD